MLAAVSAQGRVAHAQDKQMLCLCRMRRVWCGQSTVGPTPKNLPGSPLNVSSPTGGSRMRALIGLVAPGSCPLHFSHGCAAEHQLLNAELLTLWCSEAKERASLRALRNLLKVGKCSMQHVRCKLRLPTHTTCVEQAFRAACHCGDSDVEVEETLGAVNGAVFNKLIIFMLREVLAQTSVCKMLCQAVGVVH